MKKLLLTLGTVAAVAAPVAAVVACSSDTDAFDKTLSGTLELSTADLTKNFTITNTDLKEMVEVFASELLKVSVAGDAKTEKVETAGLKVLKFKVDGVAGQFDFTKDKFLHNGLVKQSATVDAKYAALHARAASVDPKTGAFDTTTPYVATDINTNDPLYISATEGLVISKHWHDAFKSAEDNAKKVAANAKAKATLSESDITDEDKVVSGLVTTLESKLRFVIRMAIAGKTKLHVSPISGSWVNTDFDAAA